MRNEAPAKTNPLNAAKACGSVEKIQSNAFLSINKEYYDNELSKYSTIIMALQEADFQDVFYFNQTPMIGLSMDFANERKADSPNHT